MRAPPAWASVAIGVLLALPALGVGHQVDDWVQLALLQQTEPVTPQRHVLLDFFTFAEPSRNAALRDVGFLPWWSPEHLQLRLFRPVSAATHLFDHVVAPGSHRFAHAHSLAWAAAFLLAAGRLFRHTLGSATVAGLALLLLAVDESRGIPIGWIANRNALVAGTFALLATTAHAVGRPGRASAWLAVGLLSGELAVTAWVWMLLWPRADRVRSLAGPTAVVVGWRLLYRWLGYGTAGSGVYLDPLGDPLGYLAALPERLVLLLGDVLLGLPSAVAMMLYPDTRMAFVAAFVPGVAWAVWALWRAPHLRPWAALAGASLLLTATTAPTSRLLVLTAVPVAAMVASVADAHPTAWSTRLLLAVHLGVAALASPLQAWAPAEIGRTLVDPCYDSLPVAELEGRTVVFVNANELCAGYVQHRLRAEGYAAAAQVVLLSSALYEVTVVREDAHTLRLEIPAGMQRVTADTLMSDGAPDAATLPGVQITVRTRDDQGHATVVEARFDRDLDDPTLLWRQARGLEAVPFPVPSVGETVVLPTAFSGG